MHAGTLTQTSGSPLRIPPLGLPAIMGAHDEVTLRHLRTPSEISTVLHLREEIDLSAHAASAADFASLEKKETSAGSWARST